jgi:hypothetical protein
MTTITIDIPEQQVAVLAAKAKAQGLTLEDWFRQVAAKEAAPPLSAAHLQKTDPEEWRRRFEEFLASRDPNTPVLSDEAMSRDSIYPDRS